MNKIIAFFGSELEYHECVTFVRNTKFDVSVYHSNEILLPVSTDALFKKSSTVSYNHWYQGIKMFNDNKTLLLNSRQYVIATTYRTYTSVPALLEMPTANLYQTLVAIKSKRFIYELYMCDYVTFMKTALFWKRINSISDYDVFQKKINKYLLPSCADDIENVVWRQWLDQLNITLINIVG